MAIVYYMFTYMCDGLSAKVRDDVSQQLGDFLVKRQVTFRYEFLLDRGIVRAHDPGSAEESFRMVFDAPRGLREGRTAWHVFMDFDKSGIRRARTLDHSVKSPSRSSI